MAQFVFVILAWSALMGWLFAFIVQGSFWWEGLAAAACFIVASGLMTTLQRWLWSRRLNKLYSIGGDDGWRH